jgi:arylsulfatase A-like enzyme
VADPERRSLVKPPGAITRALLCPGCLDSCRLDFYNCLNASPRELTARHKMATSSQTGPDAGRSVAPGLILVLSIWIGLVAGFLDLGAMVLKSRLTGMGFYHLGSHFVWIIPLGAAVLVLLPGMALALIARLRWGVVPLGLAAGLLSFVGFLEISGRAPLAFWSIPLLCAGLAIQAARLAGRNGQGFARVVWRTTPLLVAVEAAIVLFTFGRLSWSERQAVAAVPTAPPGARNVLLIVWDTVRAGNLSLHGYGRGTTPNLERLAGRGVTFRHAFATSSWTLPSHASLFTGRWPHELTADWTSPLDETHITLAEYLGSHGYDTAGFVGNLEFCGRETGLNRGFAHYEDYPIAVWDAFSRYLAIGRNVDFLSLACAANERFKKDFGGSLPFVVRSKDHVKNAADIDRSFLSWLSWQETRNRPFFAFLNYADAHTPYEVPDSSIPGFGLRPMNCRDLAIMDRCNTLDKAMLTSREVRMAEDVYDDSIFYLDRRLGVLMHELARRGVLDNTLVVVTSDHGEHLGDHLLFFHGCSLYRQVVEVPLVIVGAGLAPAGRVVEEPVSLRDVPATIAGLLDLGHGAPFPSQPLNRYWNADSQAEGALTSAEPLLMEISRPLFLTNQGREPAARGPMKSLVARGLHYIRTGDGNEELYALKSDPEERKNLAGSPGAREILERFRDSLSAMLKKR